MLLRARVGGLAWSAAGAWLGAEAVLSGWGSVQESEANEACGRRMGACEAARAARRRCLAVRGAARGARGRRRLGRLGRERRPGQPNPQVSAARDVGARAAGLVPAQARAPAHSPACSDRCRAWRRRRACGEEPRAVRAKTPSRATRRARLAAAAAAQLAARRRRTACCARGAQAGPKPVGAAASASAGAAARPRSSLLVVHKRSACPARPLEP
jgi:hypothetical protein